MTEENLKFSVNISLALEYGLDESLIIQFLINILEKDYEQGFERDAFTKEELSAQFPFWSMKEIRTRLENMVKRGILIKKKGGFLITDRTNFYLFSNKEYFLSKSKNKASSEKIVSLFERQG